jgi:hypothetical protein
MQEKFKILIELDKKDVEWLNSIYGPNWAKRLEQHIKHEVSLRRTDGLKMRKAWDY